MSDYASLSDLRNHLGYEASDTDDDALLALALGDASRFIERYAERRFYVNSADEVRYVTAIDPYELRGLDIVSITTLATDADGDRVYETTWATTDFDLLPFNAVLDGEPYSSIGIPPAGRYTFPSVAKGVKITGKFGYSAVPSPIKGACLLLAAYIFKLKDNPLGISANTEVGQIITDPKMAKFVVQKLDQYSRKGLL
jgi:hypothetical protein